MIANYTFRSILVFFLIGATNPIPAQPITREVILGETSRITINVPEAAGSFSCNVDVFLDSRSFQVAVVPPKTDFSFDITPSKVGDYTIRWEGKMKMAGLNTLRGCPGSGTIIVNVVPNSKQVEQAWEAIFSRLNSDQGACVKLGLNARQIKFKSIDPNEQLVAPNDPKSKAVLDSCDRFFQARRVWGSQSQAEFACHINGVRSICEGVYAVQGSDGQLSVISLEEAINNHFDNKAWTTGQKEKASARESRLKTEEDERARALARAEAEKKRREEENARQRQQEEDERVKAQARAQAEQKRREEENARQRQQEAERQAELAKRKKEQEELDRRRLAEQQEQAKRAALEQQRREAEAREQARRAKKEQEEAERKRRTTVKSATDA